MTTKEHKRTIRAKNEYKLHTLGFESAGRFGGVLCEVLELRNTRIGTSSASFFESLLTVLENLLSKLDLAL